MIGGVREVESLECGGSIRFASVEICGGLNDGVVCGVNCNVFSFFFKKKTCC